MVGFYGVVCTDVKLSELLKDVEFFEEGVNIKTMIRESSIVYLFIFSMISSEFGDLSRVVIST
jgi:hypothetical protein